MLTTACPAAERSVVLQVGQSVLYSEDSESGEVLRKRFRASNRDEEEEEDSSALRLKKKKELGRAGGIFKLLSRGLSLLYWS